MTCLQKNTQEEHVVVLGLHPGSLALDRLLILNCYSVPRIEIKMEFLLNPYNVMICCIYYNSCLMYNF